MSDSETVDIDLDTFEKSLASGKLPEVEVPEKEEEDTEPTPSATENESDEPEGEEPEGEDNGEDTPEEPEANEEEEEKPKPKKRKNAQERINELTAEKYEMQRRLEALERAVIEKVGQDNKSEDSPTQTVTPDPKAPNADALKKDGSPVYPLGEFDPQYIADMTKHMFEQMREESKKQDAEEKERQAVEQAQRELTESWAAKVEAASERLEDLPQKFETLQSTFKNIPQDYGNFLASSIMMLDNGPDVLDYFADNLDEAKRIVAAGPFGATIALGRLDAKFEKTKEVEKGVATRATQAPPPPPKNRGVAVAKDIRPDTDNLDDFETLFYKK